MAKVEVSVVICTYNREKYIAESILSVVNQTANQERYQLVVVNNNSKDRTDEICRQLLDKEIQFDYFIEMNQGNSHARNRGIKESKGNIIVFIDDDAMMRSDYIQNLLDFYDQNPSIDAVGGRIFPRYEEKKANWLSPVLMPLIAALDMGNKARPFRWGKFPIGANMSFRKKVFDEIGIFNVDLGRIGTNLQGGDEKDVFARMRAVDMSIWYCPDVVVDHIIPASRLEESYIKRMGIGVGESERTRMKFMGKLGMLKVFLKEIVKWGATFVLSFGYFVVFQPPKAVMLLKFRSWVSLGLIKKT